MSFNYTEHYVNNRLEFLIKKLWTLDNYTSLEVVPHKHILPNGCFNIAFIEGNGIDVQLMKKSYHLSAGIYFCGQMTEALTVDILSYTKATMLQLNAWTPVYFTKLDIGKYTDAIVPINKLTLPLAAELKLVTDPQQIIKQAFFQFGKLWGTNKISQIITAAAGLIMDTKGECTVQQMTDVAGCSIRYLQQLFKKYVGLGPKELAVIIKLRSAVDDIAYPTGQPVSMTTLALMNHFYDQAHFNNTFQAIIKTTPKKFKPADFLLSFKQ